MKLIQANKAKSIEIDPKQKRQPKYIDNNANEIAISEAYRSIIDRTGIYLNNALTKMVINTNTVNEAITDRIDLNEIAIHDPISNT